MTNARLIAVSFLIGLFCGFAIVNPKQAAWPLPLVYAFLIAVVIAALGVALFGDQQSERTGA
jgi:pilus assembly protein TadC